MKRTIYIDYTGRASRDVVIAGRQLLSGKLLPHVSALVVKEAGKGNQEKARDRLDAISTFPVLGVIPEAERLAEAILKSHGMPEEYREDALHIAIAAIAGMNFIVTWNFSHINNPFTKMMIRQAVNNAGYECPEIVSPDAFLGDDK